MELEGSREGILYYEIYIMIIEKIIVDEHYINEGTDIIVCVYKNVLIIMYVLYHYMVAPMLATYYMS